MPGSIMSDPRKLPWGVWREGAGLVASTAHVWEWRRDLTGVTHTTYFPFQLVSPTFFNLFSVFSFGPN